MADILPGYSFNARLGRYRSNATGQFVARTRILSLLDAQVSGAEHRLGQLTTAFHEGRMSASVWTEQMRTELRRLHTQQASLGAGGFDRLGSREYGRVGGVLRGEYQRLEQMAREIQAGEVSLPQALNRTNGYVGGARRQFWEAERDHRRPGDGMTMIERRTLDPAAQHCAECPDYAARGFQMMGVLPPPSVACSCGHNCRCSLLQREVPTSEASEWIGTIR